MFGRVHPEKSCEGTGIGPAVVKVRSRVGGEVGFQSEPGRRSTFYFWFTLPKPCAVTDILLQDAMLPRRFDSTAK